MAAAGIYRLNVPWVPMCEGLFRAQRREFVFSVAPALCVIVCERSLKYNHLPISAILGKVCTHIHIPKKKKKQLLANFFFKEAKKKKSLLLECSVPASVRCVRRARCGRHVRRRGNGPCPLRAACGGGGRCLSALPAPRAGLGGLPEAGPGVPAVYVSAHTREWVFC